MSTTVTDLRDRLAQIQDLRVTSELLSWDQQTMMPSRGGAQRAETMATIARVSHERFTAARTGELLQAAAAELERDGADPLSDDQQIVRRAQRDWNRARRVPDDLAGELARAGSVGHEAWVAARASNDFAAFAPHLSRNLELTRRYVDCLSDMEGYECQYDVLLDDYDPGTRTAQVARLFAELKDQLVPLIAALGAHSYADAVTGVEFPVPAQRSLVRQVLEQMGFDGSGWRLDDTVHPFASSFGQGDVRLTTRYDPRYFPTALYGAMHECGHGLYSAGVAAELRRTPLGELRSLSLHESQSRMWENMVGRSRAFCGWMAPRIAQQAGGELRELDGNTLFRAVNQVTPSLIRIEADEATYGLHIVLRFELEQELLDGRLSVADLPEAWNARMLEYLGVKVSSDADGVLQDVHWSGGSFGYFPTYALGNLISAQLWQRIEEDLPDLEDQIGAGELQHLRGWLREHVHQHGSKFTASELLDRVVGGPIEVGPYIGYLRRKLSSVYGLPLA